MVKSLYDFDDVSDVPEGLIPNRKLHFSEINNNILLILKDAPRALRAYEVCIVYYRKHNRVIRRSAMNSRLAYFSSIKSKPILKAGKGLYFFNKDTIYKVYENLSDASGKEE